jgi:serine/threonine-protein kinase
VQSNAQRFLREIKVAARLQHPHILAVHDSGSVGDDLYYVMPFVEGESLRERLNKGPLSVEMAVEIAREVADALDYAHTRGIIHRDIKPENILLTEGSGHTGGHAVVADFGIARAVELPDGEAAATATGVAVGSPAYMSPEQAMGLKNVDGRADIYSLGCVLYEMLAGKPPYGRESARAAMAGHVAGTPQAISGERPNLPPNVISAVDRALAKEPSARFPTAGAFRDALRVDTGTVSLAATLARPALKPRRLVAAAAVVLVLAVAATAFITQTGASASVNDRSTVLIADVDNATGDPVFRNSLVSALSAGVGQSDRVTLISRSRLAETLARMQRAPGDTTVSERVAVEAAKREGWSAVILPSVAIFDSTYVITARIVDPGTGGELATQTVRARGKSAIMDALDDLSRSVRRQFGESRLAVFRQSSPLPQVTTASLEALEKYAAGSKAWDSGRMDEAYQFYIGALQLDANFALAHVAMGRLLAWRNNAAAADSHFTRAMANAQRITDRERMWAEAQIASSRGDWDLAVTNYQSYISRYPGFATAWLNLGTSLMRGSRPREALAAFAEFTRLDSTSASAFINIATSYAQLTLYDSAVINYRKAFAIRPDYETWFNINHEYGTALVRMNRLDEARAAFDKMLKRPNPLDKARGLRSTALLELLEGRPANAIPLLKEAVEISSSFRERTSESRNRYFLTAAYEMQGNMAAAREESERAYQAYATGYMDAGFAARVAMLQIRHGRFERAGHMLDSIRARASQGNMAEESFSLLVAGSLARARGRSDSALTMIRRAAVLDSAAEMLEPLATLLAESGDVRGALVVEQRIRQNQLNVGFEAQFPWSYSRLRMGRLHEQLGDQAAARKEYETFLSEWADADQTLPAIVEARARLKRLMALQPKRES